MTKVPERRNKSAPFALVVSDKVLLLDLLGLRTFRNVKYCTVDYINLVMDKKNYHASNFL